MVLSSGVYIKFPFAVTDAPVSKLKTGLHDYCRTETTSELKTMFKEKENTGTEFNTINLNTKTVWTLPH